jgi:hypothetical protein
MKEASADAAGELQVRAGLLAVVPNLARLAEELQAPSGGGGGSVTGSTLAGLLAELGVPHGPTTLHVALQGEPLLYGWCFAQWITHEKVELLFHHRHLDIVRAARMNTTQRSTQDGTHRPVICKAGTHFLSF